MKNLLSTILLILCLVGLLSGQDTSVVDSGLQRDLPREPVIRETFKFVVAPVAVTDQDGNFVKGLTALDFRLTDNYEIQSVTSDIAPHPISLVVVIQANAGVEHVLPQIRKLSSVFESSLLGDSGEMAVLAFDDHTQSLVDFTRDPLLIDAAFRNLKSGSYSNHLNDAVMAGIDILRSRSVSRRRIVVLLSENRDSGSDITMREVLTAADFTNVMIYSIDISQLVSALTAHAEPSAPDPIPVEARYYSAGLVGTPTLQSQMEMGNWIPALKDIFLAAKGIFVPPPLEVYTRYTGGRQFTFRTENTLEQDMT